MMKKRVVLTAIAALLAMAILSGCASHPAKIPTSDTSLTDAVTDDPGIGSVQTPPGNETAGDTGTDNTAKEPSEEPVDEETDDTTEEPDGEETDDTTKEPDGEETPAVPAFFRACSITTDEIETFRYWLYTPSDPTEHMPLIVYLHGGSGKGDDLTLITAADGFPKYLQTGALGDVRAYVIIPQLPADQKGWPNVASALYSLISVTSSKFNIDKGNISLTGHSMGGTGTWNIALAYPALFARIAPLSGSIRNTADAIAKLKDIPIWAFVGSADTIVSPESSKDFVAALKANGANAEITVFEGADHFAVPSLTYLDQSIRLTDWLIGETA